MLKALDDIDNSDVVGLKQLAIYLCIQLSSTNTEIKLFRAWGKLKETYEYHWEPLTLILFYYI